MATIVEAIKELQANQNGVVATMKQLQENMNTTFKTNTPVTGQGASATQERRAPEPNNASFLTQADVIALLERELHMPSTEDLEYMPQPPYPMEIFRKPYPAGYEPPHFILFDGRKGNPKEHVSRFIDAMGPHAGNHDLRLREFSKSLTDRAYTWYTSLPPSSIRSWEELVSRFCRKYFQNEEHVTVIQLNNTHQKASEPLVDFVKRL